MSITSLDIDTLEKIVLAKCDSFVSMSLWPTASKLNFRAWLSNFPTAAREHALHLLNSFTYYSTDLVSSLLGGSILKMFPHGLFDQPLTSNLLAWHRLLQETCFIPVVGTHRNPTDSGYTVVSILRRQLKIPQSNIFSVDDLYNPDKETILSNYKRLVFVDDFIGSGEQFLTMWTSDFRRDGFDLKPICVRCVELQLKPSYCTTIATQKGLDRLRNETMGIDFFYAHSLPHEKSLFHENSTAWPTHLQQSGPQFILEMSEKAGIRDDVKGYDDLGLALAFEFSVPDATVPLFYWNSNGWKPLMERSS